MDFKVFVMKFDYVCILVNIIYFLVLLYFFFESLCNSIVGNYCMVFYILFKYIIC